MSGVQFDVIISIGDPDLDEVIDHPNSHQLKFFDLVVGGPTNQDMDLLFDIFKKNLHKLKFLIHCSAGVSRSSAATLLLLMLDNPNNPETVVGELFRINPAAAPNEFMVKWIEDKFKVDLEDQIQTEFMRRALS